jgi:hypothetical protein
MTLFLILHAFPQPGEQDPSGDEARQPLPELVGSNAVGRDRFWQRVFPGVTLYLVDHVEMLGFPICRCIARIFPFRIISQGACCAFCNTGGFLSRLNSVRTKTAFPHGILSRTELRHVKGTSLNAIAASDAFAADVFYDSVGFLSKSSRRAGGDAAGVGAMKAGRGDGKRFADRKGAGNMSPDVPELHARRRIVLQLACHFAGMAGYALLRIKND